MASSTSAGRGNGGNGGNGERDDNNNGIFTSTNDGGNGSVAWIYSFGATMIPFASICYAHKRGVTVRVINGIVKSPVGVYGLLALPFVTLAMEKSVYDTVQAWQGIDPNVIPADRGGFPSGGGNLPSLSLIPVQRGNTDVGTTLIRRITTARLGGKTPTSEVGGGPTAR